MWYNESLSESCLAMQGKGVGTILRSQELLSLGNVAAHFKSFQWSSMIYLLATQEPMKQAHFYS